MFIDTYLISDDFQKLASFCAYFRNVIGPQAGIPSVPEYTDEYGVVFPEQEAKGDPDKFYACVRAPMEITLPEGIEEISSDAGALIIGVWA